MALVVILFLVIPPAGAATIMVYETSDRISPVPLALIYADGEYVATTNENGTCNLSYAGTARVIRVVKAGYQEWTGIPPVNDSLVLVPLRIRTCSYAVSVRDAETLLPVGGARLSARQGDETATGDTAGENGTAILTLRGEQVYDLGISARNYQTRHEKLITGFEDARVEYSLNRNDRITVQVNDSRDMRPVWNASIVIDGKAAGRTGETGSFPTNLTRGEEHTLEISADGYESLWTTADPGEEDTVISFSLTRASQAVFISVYDPEKHPVADAGIRIDGNISGRTNEYGRLTIPALSTGEHQLDVSGPGMKPFTSTEIVEAGEADIILIVSPADLPVALLVSDPAGRPLGQVSILADGRDAVLTDAGGAAVIMLEPGRPVQITANVTGYQSNTTTITPPVSGPVPVILSPDLFPLSGLPLILTVTAGIVAAGIILILLIRGRRSSPSQKKRRELRRRSL